MSLPPKLPPAQGSQFTQFPVRQVTATVISGPADQPAAAIELPVPHVDEPALPPPPAVPITRGQAPLPAAPTNLLVALRLACTGYTAKVELDPQSETRIALRLSLAPGASADRLAEKIIALPELSGYDIEMQFVR
jgi:hypothetical protein